MNRLVKDIIVFVLPATTAVMLTIPLTLAVSKSEVASSSRQSAVNACLAANKAHNGVEKLIGQLEAHTAANKALTTAQRAEYEAGYQELLADFPALDCKANPISFAP